MLKITWDQEASPPTLKLHGKISGPWVEELDRVWSDMEIMASHLVIDLTDVTFVAQEGRPVLGRMARQGVQFHGNHLTEFIIDGIRQESPE